MTPESKHTCEDCNGRNHNVRDDYSLPKYTCMHGAKLVYDDYATGKSHYEGTVPCSIRNANGDCHYWNITGSD
jgi:hypothetical protein